MKGYLQGALRATIIALVAASISACGNGQNAGVPSMAIPQGVAAKGQTPSSTAASIATPDTAGVSITGGTKVSQVALVNAVATPMPLVTGKVLRLGSSLGVSGATVKLGTLSTVTASNGTYSFATVTKGLYYLQVTAPGYATENTGVNLVSTIIRVVHITQPTATEQMFLTQVNLDRSANGAGPVAFDEQALEAARNHANNEYAVGYYAHYDPSGLGWSGRYGKLGGVGWDEENIAHADTWQDAEAQFMAEKGSGGPHYHNLVDPGHQWVGLAVTAQDKNGLAYEDQEFVTMNTVYDPTLFGGPSNIVVGTTHTIKFLSTGANQADYADYGTLPLPTPMTVAQLDASGVPPYASLNYTPGTQIGSILSVPIKFATAAQYEVCPVAGGSFTALAWFQAH